MNDSLFILGNGFDLDLGLHTTYSDFWNSKKWGEIRNKNSDHYLITTLEKYRISNHWFDLESGLLQGARRLKERMINIDEKNSASYKESFRILVNQLKEYIAEQQAQFIPNKDSVSRQILESISTVEDSICIYSFNYTDIKTISKRIGIIGIPQVFHLHGSLKPDHEIILGIELEDISLIPDQLTFLIKSNNPCYQNNHLLRDLEAAENVIFFGHSINGMDFPYFKDYFIELANLPTDESEKKHITIITYDESSEMQIKDNFRRNGIDVRTLFNRVDLEFIMTKSIYNGNQREIDKLEKLKSYFPCAE